MKHRIQSRFRRYRRTKRLLRLTRKFIGVYGNYEGIDVVYVFLIFATILWLRGVYNGIPEQGLIESEWNERKSEVPFQSLVQEFRSKRSHSLPNGITVVSAFFDIGGFQKGFYGGYRNASHYLQWLDFYKYLSNSVVIFTDSAIVEQKLRFLRKDLPQTTIIKISQNTLWSFKIADRIKEIYSQPDYPEYTPNTVNEFYPCTMHAKYELLNQVIRQNLYSDKYVAWLDIGYFRDPENSLFRVDAPKEIDDSKILFYEQDENNRSDTPETIVLNNKVWVGGGMFIARPEAMKTFTEDYMKSVETLLNMNLMNTDQQVIYSMYSDGFSFRPQVEIQVYTNHAKNWFFLGESCRREYEKERRSQTPVVQFFHRIL